MNWWQRNIGSAFETVLAVYVGACVTLLVAGMASKDESKGKGRS